MNDSPQTLWTLLVLASLAVAALFVWARQRAGGWPRRRGGTMRLVEHLSLGPRERLVIVEVAGEHLLLGVTAQSVSRLHRLDAAAIANPPAAAPAATSFAEMLRGARDDER